MRHLKKVICIILSICLFAGLASTTFAAENKNSQLEEAKAIAQNTPSYFGYVCEWQIVQETELYDIIDNHIGYCFDMISKDQNKTTAYVMVNNNVTEFPVYLFGVDGVSPYYEKNFERAYYLSAVEQFVENNGELLNAKNGEELLKGEIDKLKKEYSNTPKVVSEDDYSGLRQMYRDGIMVLSEPDTGSISNGVNLAWRKGCAPTTVAMMIKTRYSSISSTSLIDSLASYMGTKSNGSTPFAGITTGTINYFADSTLSDPTTCGWNSTKSDGTPRTGSMYNSDATFKHNIDAGFPVGVYCSSSTVTTEGYLNGIESAHMMCGVGYSYSSAGNYIRCYTTYTADGKVSFPLTSSGLSDRAWFILRW